MHTYFAIAACREEAVTASYKINNNDNDDNNNSKAKRALVSDWYRISRWSKSGIGIGSEVKKCEFVMSASGGPSAPTPSDLGSGLF